jgi:hypothetical protein
MRKLLVIIAFVLPYFGYSQDVIVLRNGEEINCKITRVDDAAIHYDFYRGDRKVSSFVSINNIRSYKKSESDSLPDSPNGQIIAPDNTVIIDTTRYLRDTGRWINLVTFSQMYGVHAKGWSLNYWGYNLKNTSRWSIPLLIGIEIFEIYPDYFSRFNYRSVSMSYFSLGVKPFYRLNDFFFLNPGITLTIGNEELTDFHGRENSRTFFGITPSQGIYFIPESRFGITLGLSVYEKLLSSEVYRSDLGLRLEFGLKF